MRLKRLTENDYMLKNEDKIVGSYLYDCFDEEIGRIDSLLVDPEMFTPRYCEITIGGFLGTRGKTVLLPKPVVETKGIGKVITRRSQESVADAPAPTDFEQPTTEEEQEIHEYFDVPLYFDMEEETVTTEDEGSNKEEEKEDNKEEGGGESMNKNEGGEADGLDLEGAELEKA